MTEHAASPKQRIARAASCDPDCAPADRFVSSIPDFRKCGRIWNSQRKVRSWSVLALLVIPPVGGVGNSATAGEATPPAAAAKPAITPPGQPEKGFGGADYPHASLKAASIGQGGEQVWIFTPAEPVPQQPAPVVLFLHGWSALDPAPYGAWIRHLARKGNIVLYPRYQSGLLTPAAKFTPALMSAVRAALDHLGKDGAVRADPTRLVAVGHSMGGALAVRYAAQASKEKRPVPKALMVLEPGTGGSRHPAYDIDLDDLSAIPQETLVLVIVGDRDMMVGEWLARKIWRQLGHIPAAHRDYVVFRSDEHGQPPLIADHFFSLAPDGSLVRAGPLGGAASMAGRMKPDALDWRGTWRLLDALAHAAFTGKDRDLCLGDTAAQKDLGRWSDGTPVRPPIVAAEPDGAATPQPK
jgi:acetyl esterase/lipase